MVEIAERQPETARGHRLLLWLLLLAPALLHLALIFRFPLAPDETYYWDWSRRPDWGYYDQGPMVAWWIRASCFVFGDTPLGVRAGIVVAALVTQIYLFLLARDLFGERIALLSLVPTILTPLALAGGFIATYDPMVVLFWAMALYYAERALFRGSGSAWFALGAAFGLGMLSKHTMALFAPCLLLFMAALPDQRRWLRRPEPYLALGVGLLIFAPNLWWQSQHGWVTFSHLFQLTNKGSDQTFLRRFGDYVGSQAGLLTPLLFLGMVGALYWTARRGRAPGQERLWFLFAFSAPLLFFLLVTLKSKVLANWAICGWLTPPIAWVAWLEERSRHDGRARRRGALAGPFAIAGLALSAFLSGALIWPRTRTLLHVRLPASWDQMNRLYGGEELAQAVSQERALMARQTGGTVAVGAATYDTTSRLAFYLPDRPRAVCLFLGTRMNSYALWPDAHLRSGDNALVVDDFAADDPGLPPFRSVFARIEPVAQPVNVFRRGLYREPVHVYHLYRCYGYHPDPEVERPKGG